MLIAGCGDLGIALAACLPAATVYGLRRHVGNLTSPIVPVCADLLSGAGLTQLPEQIDTLVYCPTPSERSEAGYRAIYIDGLRRLLSVLPRPADRLRLLFVSSTAVYGEDAGQRVDETTIASTAAWNGRVLLDAESNVRAQVTDCVAVRLAGLYGPGRHWLLRRVQAQAPIRAGAHWTNRIHIADAARLLALLAGLPRAPECVIGVDDEPATEASVLDWLAAQCGLPVLLREGDADQSSGKRLCNDLARSLGWQPLYRSYREGYTDVLTTATADARAP